MFTPNFQYYAVFHKESSTDSVAYPVLYFDRVETPLAKYHTNQVRAYIFTRGFAGRVEITSVLHNDVIDGRRYVGLTLNPTCSIQQSV